MSRLRVALVSPYDRAYPGGVSEHVTQLDRSLRRRGHATTVIAPSSTCAGATSPSNLVVAGRVVTVPTNGTVARITLSLGIFGKVKRLLRERRFDVVHLHEPFMPLLPLVVLRYSRATNVATFHASAGDERGYRYGRLFLQRFSAYLHARIAVSEAARSYVERYFPGAYEVIPNGVDVERFQNARPLPTLNDGTPNILYVGRLEERKGFGYLLRAFSELRRGGQQARLIVVGAHDVARWTRYERAARAAGLNDIHFVGYATPGELPRYYQSADVVCVPSIGGESFGIVLLEAMAAGKPIVASNIAGYRDVVEHGSEGWLVPPADPAALAEALHLMLSDQELRHELGRHGQIKARRYAWSLVADRVLECYYSAIMVHDSAAPGPLPVPRPPRLAPPSGRAGWPAVDWSK